MDVDLVVEWMDGGVGGVVLYTGDRSYTYDDRLHVVPMDRLWSAAKGPTRGGTVA